jgi:hypothetical protein
VGCGNPSGKLFRHVVEKFLATSDDLDRLQRLNEFRVGMGE